MIDGQMPLKKSWVLSKGITLMQTRISLPVANVKFRCQGLLCSVRARLWPFWCVCSWPICLTSTILEPESHFPRAREPSPARTGPWTKWQILGPLPVHLHFRQIRPAPLREFSLCQGKTDASCLIYTLIFCLEGVPGDADSKDLPAMWETQIQSWVGKMPWRREWQLTPIFLPGEFHGQSSMAGYSP